MSGMALEFSDAELNKIFEDEEVIKKPIIVQPAILGGQCNALVVSHDDASQMIIDSSQAGLLIAGTPNPLADSAASNVDFSTLFTDQEDIASLMTFEGLELALSTDQSGRYSDLDELIGAPLLQQQANPLTTGNSSLAESPCEELPLSFPAPEAITTRARATRMKKRATSVSSTCSSPASTVSDKKNNGSGKKRKMYEGNANDPKVQRASYAKGYREKKKMEKDFLKEQLSNAVAQKEALQKNFNEFKMDYEKQGKVIAEMKRQLAAKDKSIQRLEKELDDAKAKSACPPDKTMKILRNISAVVRSSCQKGNGSRCCTVMVDEKLANKPCFQLTDDQIRQISAKSELGNTNCTIVMSLEDDTANNVNIVHNIINDKLNSQVIIS